MARLKREMMFVPPLLRPALGLFLFLAAIAPARADNPFGIMLWPTDAGDMPLLAARARGLGVGWFRPPAVFLDRWQGLPACPPCGAPRRAGLKTALTVRNGGSDGLPRRPSSPPDDLPAYRHTLADVLDAWKPDLLVVENEEGNPRFFETGRTPAETAAAYGRELGAACEIAHAKGAACANGGLTGDRAAAFAWLTLLSRQDADTACDFARRAFSEPNDRDRGQRLCAYRSADEVPAAVRAAMLGNIEDLLAQYRTQPVDRVNLHWFGHDAGALAIVAQLLAQATGKPVMSNEIGQLRGDSDPANVRPLLRAAFASGLDPAIWFSIDTPTTVSLFNLDGSLRPGGREFVHQMSGLK